MQGRMSGEMDVEAMNDVSCGLREVQEELQSVQQASNTASAKLAALANKVLVKLEHAVDVQKDRENVKSTLSTREQELTKVRRELATLLKRLELSELSKAEVEARMNRFDSELQDSKKEVEQQKDVVQYLEKVILFLTLSFPFSLLLERSVRNSKL